MMKKGIYAILAVLTVFAMVLTGCPDGDNGGKDEPTFTVTFDTGDGGSKIEPQKVKKDGYVTRPAAPTNNDTDLAFDNNWYTDTAKTTPWNFNTGKVTADMTLYAKWIKNANLGSLKIDSTDVTTLGQPAATLAGVGAGSYEPGTLQPVGGVTIEVTAQSNSATLKWLVGATTTDPTENNFDTATMPTDKQDLNGKSIYIRITNGDVKSYYKINVFFTVTATIKYGQPSLDGGLKGTIDPKWEAQYDGPILDLSRINTKEVSNPPFKFLNTVVPGKNHTEGIAKAYWDDEGLYIYATITFHDYYDYLNQAEFDAAEPKVVTPRVTQLRGNYTSDSFEIMVNTRAQLLPGNSDTAIQYRVGFNDGGTAINVTDNYKNEYGNFTIGGNFRSNPFVPELNPRHVFGQTYRYNAWITKDATGKETGYIVIAHVPWILIGNERGGINETSEVFDATGKVKDNAKIGLDLQINASTTPNDPTNTNNPTRDALITMSSVTVTAVEDTRNYANITLAPPAPGTPRPVETHFPSIHANGTPYVDDKTDGQTMYIDALVAPAVPTPALTYQWWSGTSATDAGAAITGATSATYKPADPAAAETAKTNFWVVVTNTNSAATTTDKTKSVTSRRFEYKTKTVTTPGGDPAWFTGATGIALNTAPGGTTGKEGATAFDATNTIATLGTGYSTIGINIPSGLASGDSFVITYACIADAGQPKIIVKQGKKGDNWVDILGSTNKYPTLTTTAVTTIELPFDAFAADGNTYVVFQLNTDQNADGKFRLKVISVAKK